MLLVSPRFDLITLQSTPGAATFVGKSRVIALPAPTTLLSSMCIPAIYLDAIA